MGKYYLYCKKADFAEIAAKYHISPMTARILRNRDICSDEEIQEYLNGDLTNCHDPFQLKGVKDAVVMIKDAIKDGKKIRVIGDYDVDGICSSYILKHTIAYLGGLVDVRLPDRILEGYGMNCQMIREASADRIGLIITCDNGVSAHDAVHEAKTSGIDVIVTDHHEVPYPLVEADIVIDPKQEDCPYPFKELCGGGVAYKVAEALLSGDESLQARAMLDDLLQYAGMATVADLVPLTGENRILAKEGIKRLRKTENKGLRAILEERCASPEDINEYYIGFIIGPCLNSAGRLSNAKIAYDLLEETDSVRAHEKAKALSDLNDERKELTVSQTDEAESIIHQFIAEEGGVPKVLVVYLPSAHESVAGIIAGRLKDIYSRPSLVITNSDVGLKGSGRSVEAYDLIGELKKHAELFQKYGGHKKAVGFSLKEGVLPDTLSKTLNEDCFLSDEELTEKVWVDMELPFKYITESFIEELKLLGPFGLKNERPLFARRNVQIGSILLLGKNQNVLKLLLEDEEGYQIEAVQFGPREKIARKAEELNHIMEENTPVTIFYFPDLNEFHGRKSLQAKIVDII